MKNYKDIPNARLATDRYDFQEHIEGADFNHNASGIFVDPNVIIDDGYYSTVASALDAISAYIVLDKTNGIGFTAIGDGYDTYYASLDTPDTPYDSLVPSLDGALNDLLNNPLNEKYHRIRSGGVVLIKAGTYKLTDTVEVPPGIILMGEGFGTKIINQMSVPKPLFKIKADLTRIADNGIDANEKFIFSRQAIITNMVIADNFVEPKFLGDLSYKDPINNDSIEPLIAVEEGSSFMAQSVKFIGKTKYLLSVLDELTSHAISIDSTIPLSSGTNVIVKDCDMDGFAQPIRFTPSGAVANYLSVSGCNIRSHGYLNNDLVLDGYNCFFYTNDVNVSIQNNYLYAYLSNVNSGLVVANTSTAPTYQAKSRMIVSNNNVSYDRTSGSVNNTFAFVSAGASAGTDYSVLQYGNSYDNWDDFEIYANGSLWLKLDSTNQIFVAPNNFNMQANTVTFITGGVAITDGATNAAAAGDLRLTNEATITARNAGDSGDVLIAEVSASDTVNLSTSLTLHPVTAATEFKGSKVLKYTTFEQSGFSSYTVDSGATADYVIIVIEPTVPPLTAVSINLPPHYPGRELVIKDGYGSASSYNITLVRDGGTGKIEGVASSYVMNADYQCVRLISDGTNWHIIK